MRSFRIVLGIRGEEFEIEWDTSEASLLKETMLSFLCPELRCHDYLNYIKVIIIQNEG